MHHDLWGIRCRLLKRLSPPSFVGRNLRSLLIRETIRPTSLDRKKCLTKVLMDGGSGLNILYVRTLDAMRIPRSKLRLESSPFHNVIPGAQAYPLGQINLPVMFGD